MLSMSLLDDYIVCVNYTQYNVLSLALAVHTVDDRGLECKFIGFSLAFHQEAFQTRFSPREPPLYTDELPINE